VSLCRLCVLKSGRGREGKIGADGGAVRWQRAIHDGDPVPGDSADSACCRPTTRSLFVRGLLLSTISTQACAVNATMSRSHYRHINASFSATTTSPRVCHVTVVSASAALPRHALDLTVGLMATQRRGRGGHDCVRSGYNRQAAMGSTYRHIKCVRTGVLLCSWGNGIALPPV
jgi:hypothetical protein